MFGDIKIIKEKDPAVKNYLQILLFYPGLHAVLAYRIAHFLVKLKIPLIPYFLMALTRAITNIEIHPKATIGERFFIDHGTGIVIGETTEIGDDVVLYQGVTLGGTGKEKGKRHPTLGNNIVVGAGAKILGSFKVGDNVNIGANAVVLSNVPENSTVVGIPGRIVKMDGQKIKKEIFNLDHIDFPDPLMKKLKELEIEIHSMEEKYNTCRKRRSE
ncbi:MAG: serine O-acetyltransferase [Fusobacteriia bacterium 4572_132]|nr:MAG: serine O-acetyltransferase [Fusobacteriia bacterium 4572_132]